MPTANKLRRWFWILIALNAVFLFVYTNSIRPVNTGQILQFETAGTLLKARSLLADWSRIPGFHDKLLLSIYLDYVFIVLYAGLLIVAAVFFAGKSGQYVLGRASRFISVLVLGAAICDLIENLAMTYTLTEMAERWSVRLAYDMAMAKFSVLILTLLFLIVCLLFSINLRKPKPEPFKKFY